MSNRFSSIEDAIAQIANGGVVIVVDAEDRENEGDFICAAEKATPETINFILNGRGMFCLAVLEETRERLKLHRLANPGETPFDTPMLTPIDHRDCRTGITADERALTIREVLNPSSKASDFRAAGHVTMLLAKEGGVLRRAGHTEASVDLARMAGLHPAGVLCEILDPQGNRADRNELFRLAAQHNLPIVTIEEMIRYRRQREQLVERLAEADLPTRYGMARIIAYGVKYESQNPVVIRFGNLHDEEAPLVRLHSSCFTGDLIASLRCDCGDQLHSALERIATAGTGALIYLPQEGRGIGLVEKVKAYGLQDRGMDTVEANLALGHKADMRDYGIGIQLLKDLGLSKIRLLTNNPKKTDAFIYGGFDLQIVEQVPIVATANPHNREYLAVKRDKMGHLLPQEE